MLNWIVGLRPIVFLWNLDYKWRALLFLRDPRPYLREFKRKPRENSERLGWQARPGFETWHLPRLPVLSITTPPLVARNSAEKRLYEFANSIFHRAFYTYFTSLANVMRLRLNPYPRAIMNISLDFILSVVSISFYLNNLSASNFFNPIWNNINERKSEFTGFPISPFLIPSYSEINYAAGFMKNKITKQILYKIF